MKRWMTLIVRALLAVSLFAIFNGGSECYPHRSEPPGFVFPQ